MIEDENYGETLFVRDGSLGPEIYHETCMPMDGGFKPLESESLIDKCPRCPGCDAEFKHVRTIPVD